MRTIAEMGYSWVLNKICGGAELTDTNNFLKLKINQLISLRGETYRVAEINILTEESRGEEFHIAEYIINDKTRIDTDKGKTYHLWVYPSEDVDEKYLILKFESTFSAAFDFARSSGLVDAVKDPEGLTTDNDTDAPGLYVRRFGDTEPHNVRKKILTSTRPRQTTLTYWDYEYKEGSKTSDFIFVTESAEGWYDLLEGNEISYQNIIV